MLYQKLTDTTITFPHVKVTLGNIQLFEFSLGKSYGIKNISNFSDKCQENLNTNIYRENCLSKSCHKSARPWQRKAKFLSRKNFWFLSWIPLREQKILGLVCFSQVRLRRSTLMFTFSPTTLARPISPSNLSQSQRRECLNPSPGHPRLPQWKTPL